MPKKAETLCGFRTKQTRGPNAIAEYSLRVESFCPAGHVAHLPTEADLKERFPGFDRFMIEGDGYCSECGESSEYHIYAYRPETVEERDRRVKEERAATKKKKEKARQSAAASREADLRALRTLAAKYPEEAAALTKTP